MSAVLAEEITQPGPGRLRALFVDGGNPANAIPDQRRMVEALRALDLLVCIEPFMTSTARLAHYILPPKLMFERYDLPSRDYETIVVNQPYAQYCVPVVDPPPGSEVIDDWYALWGIAQRLGRTVVFDGVPLDMAKAPSTEDLLALLARHSAVPFEQLRSATEGRLFEVEPMMVAAGDPQSTACFDVLPADVAAELSAVLREPVAPAHGTHRLAVRRLRDVQNTMYRELPSVRRRVPHNPAWLNPADLEALGVAPGELVEIRSQRGALRARAEADPALRPGVVAMSHGWGGLPDAPLRAADTGACTGMLIDTAGALDPINAMPVMTGVPVTVSRVAAAPECVLPSKLPA
jgi:anaerobic selenocysteine-containing dehydrogenase